MTTRRSRPYAAGTPERFRRSLSLAAAPAFLYEYSFQPGALPQGWWTRPCSTPLQDITATERIGRSGLFDDEKK